MLDLIKKHWQISAVFAFLVVVAGVATFAQQFRGKYQASNAGYFDGYGQLGVEVIGSGIVQPGSSYTLRFNKVANGIPGPHSGLFDVESIVCNSEVTQCSAPVVVPWGDYRSDNQGYLTVNLPTTFPSGLYRARFRERGQSYASWSNQIDIRVQDLTQLSVTVLEGGITQPGGSYRLQFTKKSNGIDVPYLGTFDAESTVCNLEVTKCAAPVVVQWGNYDSTTGFGTVTVNLPANFPPGLYRARFRPRGQSVAPWSNRIDIRVQR